MIDYSLFQRVLADFARSLVSEYDVGEILYDLTDRVNAVLAVDGAGVSLGNDDGQLEFITATDAAVVRIEEQQTRFREGPCHDAWRGNELVKVAHIEDWEDRWPKWSQAALGTGWHAVLGVPMHLDGASLGALNVYARDPREWDDDETMVAGVLADVATSSIVHTAELRRSQALSVQLQGALDSRIVIEQAKGVVAERHGIDVAEAFDLIRRHARGNNRKLREVARELIEGALSLPVD